MYKLILLTGTLLFSMSSFAGELENLYNSTLDDELEVQTAIKQWLDRNLGDGLRHGVHIVSKEVTISKLDDGSYQITTFFSTNNDVGRKYICKNATSVTVAVNNKASSIEERYIVHGNEHIDAQAISCNSLSK